MRIQPIFCTPIQRTNFKSSNKAEEQIKRQEDELHKEEDEIKKQMDFLNREQHKLDNEEYKLEGVTMNIKENTLTKGGATIIITDDNKTKYTYEEYYKLEKRIDHIWYELKPNSDVIFNEMGYLVDDNNELEMNIIFKIYYR